MRWQVGIVLRLEMPGTPIIRKEGISIKVIEPVFAQGRADESGGPANIGKGGTEDGVPGLRLHRGKLIQDNMTQAHATQPVGTVRTFNLDASSVDQPDLAVVLPRPVNDGRRQVFQQVPDNIPSLVIGRSHIPCLDPR